MAHSPAIHIKHLTLSFAHHFVFDNLSLDIPANRWTCLLGASGVGKTTLLRLMAGLLPKTQTGEICQYEAMVSDGQPLLHRIAYMAQQDLLMPWLNVLDNALLGYRLRGERIPDVVRTKAKQLLIQVGLQEALYLTPEKLSGGMRQRVALVRTLLEDRPIVLMDEPFSALDTVTRLKLHDLAVKLLAGKTVLFITHDPLEALRLGDNIYLLAGKPAKIEHTFTPAGIKPRSLTDTQLLSTHAELLTLLISCENQNG